MFDIIHTLVMPGTIVPIVIIYTNTTKLRKRVMPSKKARMKKDDADGVIIKIIGIGIILQPFLGYHL